MNKIKMSRFLLAFLLYIVFNSIYFMMRTSADDQWFSQWIFHKFFVFQFISILVIGLIIDSHDFGILSVVRSKDRRNRLKSELLRSYQLGFLCVTMMFLFVILGALLIQAYKNSAYIWITFEWYFRYLFGVILFINISSCLKWTNNWMFSRYSYFITFVGLIFELLILKPYIRKFFLFELNLSFSWVFHRGFESFIFLFILIIVSLYLNIQLSIRRDFL